MCSNSGRYFLNFFKYWYQSDTQEIQLALKGFDVIGLLLSIRNIQLYTFGQISYFRLKNWNIVKNIFMNRI